MARNSGYNSSRSADEALHGLIDTASRVLFFAGAALAVLSAGFLVFYFFMFNQPQQANAAGAMANIELFKKILFASAISCGVGATFKFWGEEVLGPLLLIGGGLLYFAPILLGAPNAMSALATTSAMTLQGPGIILAVFGIFNIGADVLERAKFNARHGAKSDTLKIGKGVKEEKDTQNILLGKCWQLPFCRKFVRDRCPIYHAKTACWKERVGCMCEESVIKNAMEGRTIPRDMVAAAQYIPRNTSLSQEQKIDRCRQCVIYNERQRQKYKVALPLCIIGPIVLYVVGRESLKGMLTSLIVGADKAITTATLNKGSAIDAKAGNIAWLQEILLVALTFVLIAYLLKVAEYVFFKLKV